MSLSGLFIIYPQITQINADYFLLYLNILSVYVRVRLWLIIFNLVRVCLCASVANFCLYSFGNRVGEFWLSFPPCGLKASAQFTPMLSMMTIMLRASSMPEVGFKKFRVCATGSLMDKLLK
jgi:hypothetical protein